MAHQIYDAIFERSIAQMAWQIALHAGQLIYLCTVSQWARDDFQNCFTRTNCFWLPLPHFGLGLIYTLNNNNWMATTVCIRSNVQTRPGTCSSLNLPLTLKNITSLLLSGKQSKCMWRSGLLSVPWVVGGPVEWEGMAVVSLTSNRSLNPQLPLNVQL